MNCVLSLMSCAQAVDLNLGSIEPQGLDESVSGVRWFGSPYHMIRDVTPCLASLFTNTVYSY